MVAPVIVVIDKGIDLRLQIARQEVVFEQDAVLQGLVPTLDLALASGGGWVNLGSVLFAGPRASVRRQNIRADRGLD